MPSFPALSGLLKVAVPVALGAVLAGVLALAATENGGSGAPGPLASAATPTPIAEARPTPPEPPATRDVNQIPPDGPALSEVNQAQAALAAAGRRCPPSYLFYDSQLLGGNFCYPPTWTLVFGDRPVLPPAQRPDGYASGLLLVKKDASGKELARVVIQLTYDPRSRPLDCPQAGQFQAGSLAGKVCFRERRVDNYNSVPEGSARIINVGLPHKLDLSAETKAAVEIADQTPGQAAVRFSSQDQQEGLAIIASIRFGP